jgi:hypothetical protein
MFSAVKYFQQIIFSEKYDFFENILWHLVFTKIHQWRKTTSDEIPSLASRIPTIVVGFRHKWPDSGETYRNLAQYAEFRPVLPEYGLSNSGDRQNTANAVEFLQSNTKIRGSSEVDSGY